MYTEYCSPSCSPDVPSSYLTKFCSSQAHLVTKESLPKLEKMVSERDAQIDFLTKNVTSMELELARLKVNESFGFLTFKYTP